MRKICLVWFSIPYFLCSSIPILGNTIALYLRPYPYPKEETQKVTTKLRKAGKIAKHTINGLSGHPIVAGIIATYGGFLDISDQNGLIAFPRKHTAQKLYILITPQMTPITMFAQTIHHWELNPGIPAQMFLIEKKIDEQTQKPFFDVQEVPLPENNIIPLEALVLVAKPTNMYIPTGITITHKSENWMLPDIYTKKGINVVDNTLYLLNLSHLFKPVSLEYKKEALRYRAQFKE